MDGFMRALVSVWTDSGFAADLGKLCHDFSRTCFTLFINCEGI